MQRNGNLKTLLDKCARKVKEFLDGAVQIVVSLFTIRKHDLSSEDVLDAEYEVIEAV